jgi:hypothetical protein
MEAGERHQNAHDGNLSDLCDSEGCRDLADREDNVTLDSDDGSEASFTSGPKDSNQKDELNMSFNGGYVPNMDLDRVDKGEGNP